MAGYAFVELATSGELPSCKNTDPSSGYATTHPKNATIPQSIYYMLSCHDPAQDKEGKCQAWRQAEAAQEQACLSRYQFWIGSAIGLVGLAGLFLTLDANRRSANEAAKAAVAAADGVKVSEKAFAATQRPWVSVDVAIRSGLKIENDEGRIRLELTLGNPGLSPATNIQIRSRICGSTEFHKVIAEMSQEARELAKKRRDAPLGKMVGFSLFPNETALHTVHPCLRPTELIEKMPRTPGMDEPGVIIQLQTSPVIVGLISYFSPIDRMDHQTGFMYLLWHVPHGVRTLIPIRDGVIIPADELALERAALGGYVD